MGQACVLTREHSGAWGGLRECDEWDSFGNRREEREEGRKPFHYGEQKGDKREATWAVKFIPI